MATSPQLPRTPQSAPPNFYSQAGAGAASPAAASPGASPAGGAQGPDKEADHEFLDMVAKILGLLDKMKGLKPKGQDVGKYVKATAQVMKDCVKQVFSGGDDVPGGQSQGADSGGSPADPGSTGPPAMSAGPGAGAGGGGGAGGGMGQ